MTPIQSHTSSTRRLALAALATAALLPAGPALAKGKPAPKAKPAAKAKPAPAAPAKKPLMVGPITLMGVVDTRAIFTDTARVDSTLPTTGLKTRYTGTGTGFGAAAAAPAGGRRILFRVSQLSLQAMVPVAEGWSLKTRLNADLEPAPTLAGRMSQGFAGGASIGVIYGFMHGINKLGKNSEVKLGAFSLPFLHESNGPIGTGKWTLSSGAASAAVKGTRVEGLEAHWLNPGKATKGGFVVGLFNNADGYGAGSLAANAASGATNHFRIQDIQGDISATGGDLDGNVGFYLDGHLESTKDLWQVDLGYFDNGGDVKTPGVTDTNYIVAGGRVNFSPNFLLQAHFIDGDSKNAVPASADWTAASVTASANYEANRFSLRYDKFQNEINNTAGQQEDGSAWTLAYRRQLSPEQALWVEYIAPENSPTTAAGRTKDARDNLLQIAYQHYF